MQCALGLYPIYPPTERIVTSLAMDAQRFDYRTYSSEKILSLWRQTCDGRMA
ncbi:hypothetical protein COCCADRAFT_102895 [Bipolaris zeicola 26-R-13]|uniref:Uncharacterized protein n=1 Tax=Cochliobolus carbonum (strain 26-R-13) TaxID=930089 RepID=W6YHP5_COCC2|nr:uncharacterized protein COCCADRAFT_102895 [Bipolaris zeicola 26-R-13]EUC30831.1 hypothetical protein COCCADRAFT_102895 [Bipolaris zeicola 26-R-13]